MDVNIALNLQGSDISAGKRNFSKSFIGDWLNDYFLREHRRAFLQRNLKKALAGHEARMARKAAHRRHNTSTLRTRSNGAALKVSSTQILSEDRPATNGFGSTHQEQNVTNGDSSDAPRPESTEHDTSVPADRAMSKRALKSMIKDSSLNATRTRVSLRHLTKPEDNTNAELEVDLSNIRKKLNWKTNRPTLPDAPRPKKRARLETAEQRITYCHAHLSIWDNSPGKRTDALKYSNTVPCTIVKDEADVDNVVGFYVGINLRKPFKVPREQLLVEAPKSQRGQSSPLVFAQNYFMEIKITPEDDDELAHWPPVPLLGKSEGDQVAKLDHLAKTSLQDSLVARHYNLTPGAETPLSVFYYNDGVSFRTKYGLEIKAVWKVPEPIDPQAAPGHAAEVEPWMVDNDNRLFGTGVPIRKKPSRPFQVARKTTSSGPAKKPPPTVGKIRKVIYKINACKGDGATRAYREITLNSISCFTCAEKQFKKTEHLLFHLDSAHGKYRYTYEETRTLETGLEEHVIRVDEPPAPKPRRSDNQESPLQDKLIKWEAPDRPFDLRAHYLDGDQSWAGEESRPKPRGRHKANGSLKEVHGNASSGGNHSDFVSYDLVRPARPAQYQRKKYRNVRLLTRDVSTLPFTSISHRAIVPEDEDECSRSETDDEIDDEWFVQHHLEELDVYAKDHKWLDAKRRLMKKWSYHILHREKSPHSKYMSDCLIRFVRLEKPWILRRGVRWSDKPNQKDLEEDSRTALNELMCELRHNKVISQTVCDDVARMLDLDDDELILPDEEKAMLAREHENRSTQPARLDGSDLKSTSQAHLSSTEELWKLTPDTCGKCRGKIAAYVQRAVRCSNTECCVPGVYYHAKCAGLGPIGETFTTQGIRKALLKPGTLDALSVQRRDWRCPLCKK